MTRRFLLLFSTAGLVLLTAESGNAQIKAAGANIERAEELFDAANALYDKPGQWRRAAELHLEEVTYRNDEDPQAVVSLLLAGYILRHTGDRSRSIAVLEEAGRRAIAIGDVVSAARAYTDAAFVAQEAGKDTEVKRFARMATLLGKSPLLPESQRMLIARRFDVKK